MKESEKKRLMQTVKDMAIEYASFTRVETSGPAGSSTRFRRAFRRAVKIVQAVERRGPKILLEDVMRSLPDA